MCKKQKIPVAISLDSAIEDLPRTRFPPLSGAPISGHFRGPLDPAKTLKIRGNRRIL